MEIWPRIFLIAYYPTCGNGLFCLLLQNITGIFSKVTMYQQNTNLESLFELITKSKTSKHKIARSYSCKNGVTLEHALPIFCCVATFKSHYPCTFTGYETQISYPLSFTTKRHRENVKMIGSKMEGIIRLVRNPGDHIIQNLFR